MSGFGQIRERLWEPWEREAKAHRERTNQLLLQLVVEQQETNRLLRKLAGEPPLH